MNRESFLRIHGIDSVAWAARFGIEPFSMQCERCGAEMVTSIPIAQGQLRGLIAPECECGNSDTPYCIVRDWRYGDLFTGRAAPSPIPSASKGSGRLVPLR